MWFMKAYSGGVEGSEVEGMWFMEGYSGGSRGV